MTSTEPTTSDPILAKRQRIERLVGLALRLGYGLFALAMILFFGGLLTDNRTMTSTPIVWCLLLGSALLAPAMVFKYAIKAAYRADREDSW